MRDRSFRKLPLPWFDGRWVQGTGTHSRWHPDSPLLAIPASCSRVPDYNPNWGCFSRFAPPRDIASHCSTHCIVYEALSIRAMMIWRHPLLPPSCLGSLLWHSNIGQGLRSLPDLTGHLAARADDDRAAPVTQLLAERDTSGFHQNSEDFKPR